MYTKCSGTLPSWLCMFAKAILPNCQAYFVPPQVNVSRSIWPSRELHIAILPNCQIHIAQVGLFSLSTPLYQIARLTLPKLAFSLSQRHSTKLQGWHCPSWPFLCANATLANCKVDIAQVDVVLFCQCHSTILQCLISTSVNLKATLPGLYSRIANLTLLFCQLAKSSLPYGINAWMSFKLATNFTTSWTSKVWMFCLVCPNFCPRKLDCPCYFCFFHRQLRALPQLLPFSLPSLSFHCFCDLMGLWSLQGALSKFKLPSKFVFEHIESKFVIFLFQISCILKIHFCEWCGFESIVVGWKSIHESSWNPWMK